jgi:hypothetical protein
MTKIEQQQKPRAIHAVIFAIYASDDREYTQIGKSSAQLYVKLLLLVGAIGEPPLLN